jgi:hypothetical protein
MHLLPVAQNQTAVLRKHDCISRLNRHDYRYSFGNRSLFCNSLAAPPVTYLFYLGQLRSAKQVFHRIEKFFIAKLTIVDLLSALTTRVIN